MDAGSWDERYAASELVWGADPNRFVAAELRGVPAGRALDVACGEGRNAIWLATRGWQVVGVDFSAVAIERARRLAEQAGVATSSEFRVGDVTAGELPAGPFDAVLLAYLQLPADSRRRALAAAAQRLGEGGRLVVVGHDSANLAEGYGGPQDPAVLFTADDVAGDLPSFVEVEKAVRVERPVATDQGERAALDALVVARRR